MSVVGPVLADGTNDVMFKDVPCDRTGVYGDLIRFRSLEHAPLNEQGVVFLFGMICRDLGYVVEKLKSGFPDCEAKRQVRPGSGSAYGQVRIPIAHVPGAWP